jgi:hypothetical protein
MQSGAKKRAAKFGRLSRTMTSRTQNGRARHGIISSTSFHPAEALIRGPMLLRLERGLT